MFVDGNSRYFLLNVPFNLPSSSCYVALPLNLCSCGFLLSVTLIRQVMGESWSKSLEDKTVRTYRHCNRWPSRLLWHKLSWTERKRRVLKGWFTWGVCSDSLVESVDLRFEIVLSSAQHWQEVVVGNEIPALEFLRLSEKVQVCRCLGDVFPHSYRLK